MMLVNYVCKPKKSVLLLSSSHPTDEIMPDDQRKPRLINDYNHTKYGVDKLGGMTQAMSCIRATRRWKVNVFSNMLDMICLNSFICYREVVDASITRNDFMMKLCLDLCKSNVQNGLSITNLPTTVKSNIFKLYPDLQPPDLPKEERPKPAKNEKCDLCIGLYNERKFATQFYTSCDQKICEKHQKEPKRRNCE